MLPHKCGVPPSLERRIYAAAKNFGARAGTSKVRLKRELNGETPTVATEADGRRTWAEDGDKEESPFP
jgi:hypothetical protein